jgi:hypothetical protein
MALNLGRIFGRLGRSALVLTSALAMLSALACGGGDEAAKTSGTPAAEAQSGGDLDLSGGAKASVKPVITTGELPDGYPADIPVPAGAEPDRGLLTPNQGGLVTFHTSSSQEDTFSYFKKELANQGWKVDSEQNDLRLLVRATKEGRKASITISSGANGTEYAVTFEGS